MYIKTEGSTTMRPELKQKNIRSMREISHDQLRKTLALKGILKEQVYSENE